MGWLSFLKQTGASVPTPATNKVAIFVDSSSGDPSYKDDTGTIHSLVGGGGSAVPSVNGITAAVTIAAGSGAAVSTVGSTVTVSLSGGGGTLPVFFFEDYGADPTGVADSTSSIQDAIDAAATAGGGVLMPATQDAIYLLSGAMQDTYHANAQLLMPVVGYVSQKPIPIIFAGWIPPAPVVSVIGSEPLPTTGLRFKSTSSASTGNVFGCSNSGSFSNILVAFYRVTVELPANPQISAINMNLAACMKWDDLLIHTGTISVADITTPTHSTSYGLLTPSNGNGALTDGGLLNVVGFYTGIEVNEHAVGKQTNFWGCIRAAVFASANHASYFDRLMTVHCANGLIGQSTHYTKIAQFDIEHAASGDFVPVYDIDDASNTIFGELTRHVVLAGTGIDRTFLINGAGNVSIRELGRAPGIRDFSGSTDTAVVSDLGGLIRYTGSGAATATIPSRSSVPSGGGIRVFGWVQQGTGQLTLSAGSGVTVGTSSSNTTRAQYSVVYAIETAPDVYLLTGDLT
jgi:hypothetical protein